MKAETTVVIPKPHFDEDSGLLLARCLRCWEHPGSRYKDGSGLCAGCHGAGWHVLAMEVDASSTQQNPNQETEST